MSNIQENSGFDKAKRRIDKFCEVFKISQLLKIVNAEKTQGLSGRKLFTWILRSVFSRMSLSSVISHSENESEIKKDTVYRFLNKPNVNWEYFILLLAGLVIGFFAKLTNAFHRHAIILDDTAYHRDRSKHVELLSWCYDHTDGKFYKGFSLFTMGWSDGVSFIPMLCKLLCCSKDKPLISPSKIKEDNRTLATKRRKEAYKDKLSIALDTLYRIRNWNIARYVMFDSWFTNADFLISLKEIGFDAICRAKKKWNQRVLFQGKLHTLAQIYAKCKKRRGKSEYLLSVPITLVHLGHSIEIDAKCVFVRNRNQSKDWIPIISTDMELTEHEIIQMYGKRWGIETFFKMCKSTLRLTSDFQGRSYDAMTAHSTMVFVRYIYLAYEQRLNNDQRTMGELFYATSKELEDIPLMTTLNFLLQQLVSSFADICCLTKRQIDDSINHFLHSLPLCFQEILCFKGCET